MARERLFKLLDEAREHKPAICVVGPPGAGKTTLVASWLDARSIKGIWYQVDPGDADLATFFYYLGEAAKPFTRKGQRPLPLLTPEYLHDVERFSRRFFREIFSRLPAGSTLTLDSYQEVHSSHVLHRMIAAALEEVPPGTVLILLSRQNMPECYSRAIANGAVASLGWPDLRLTASEAEAIAVEKGHADAKLVGNVCLHTDGWAAGITLMLERRHANVSDLPTSEQHEAIFEYFAGEIFQHIEEEGRSVLMTTAWLPTVSIALAAALTGHPRVENILEDLYRRHLFVHRKASNPPSYQYHALFRAFLQAQAHQALGAPAIAALRRKSARLLEQTNEVDAAIDLYCDAGEYGDAVPLIVAAAPRLLAHGRWKTVDNWITRLPAHALDSSAWLRYWLGVSRFASAPTDARRLLRQAADAFRAEGHQGGQLLCLVGLMESHWAEFSGDDELESCLGEALPLLARFPDFQNSETELRVLCVVHVSMLLRQPRNPMIETTRSRIVAFLSADITDDAKLLAGSALLAEGLQTGNLSLAGQVIAAIGHSAESARVSPVARLMWLIRLPEYYTHRAEHQKAEEVLAHAEALLEQEGVLIGRGFLYYSAAFDYAMARQFGKAERYVEKVEATSAALERPLYKDLARWLRCVIALARDEPKQAAEFGAQAVAGVRARKVTWPIVWCGVAYIYALLEAGAHDAATIEIQSLRDFLRGSFMSHFEVELLFAEAYLALKTDRRDEFRERLTAAWDLAHRTTFIFGYRDAFRPHRVLFRESLKHGIRAEYVRSTIRQFRIRPESKMEESWPWPVKVQALGRFVVLLDDQPLSFGKKAPRKPIALLKAIISLGEEGVPEQRLIDALWPEEEGDAGYRVLALTLHRLRRLLGHQDAVTLVEGMVALNNDVAWTDVRAFEELLKRGAWDQAESIAALLRLYRGNFLADDVGEPWSISTRERLRGKFLSAVDSAGSALERLGQFEAAIALYLRGLDADSLAETFYQGLMRCYASQGRPAEALSTYRRLRQTLSVVLGIQPSPATEALVRQLRGGERPAVEQSVNHPKPLDA